VTTTVIWVLTNASQRHTYCYCHHCDRTATNAMQFFCRHRNSPTVQIEVENIAQSKTISLIIDLQINTTTRNKGSKQQSTNDASWMLLFVNDTHLWYCIQSVSNDNVLASMQQSMILVSMNTTINEWVDCKAKRYQ
jgi:hypothetical protein